jgi:hypothetical protein
VLVCLTVGIYDVTPSSKGHIGVVGRSCHMDDMIAEDVDKIHEELDSEKSPKSVPVDENAKWTPLKPTVDSEDSELQFDWADVKAQVQVLGNKVSLLTSALSKLLACDTAQVETKDVKKKTEKRVKLPAYAASASGKCRITDTGPSTQSLVRDKELNLLLTVSPYSRVASGLPSS